MKLLTKNSYKFMTGMFWQIPDDNKRSVNFSKLVKDTNHDMYCFVNNIKPTWGFCHKSDLQGEKKVASLGKLIIELSNLTADYANSIICFKFKSINEIDEDGKSLNSDLFGYIILLNGTICPDEGEYVAEFEAIRESIIQKAKKYEIDALYLPVDVSGAFFNIFERLDEAFNIDELLIKTMEQIDNQANSELKEFVSSNFPLYNQIFDWPINLDLLRKLIKEPKFEQKVKEIRDLNIRYLFSNIYTIPYTSDEIYWSNDNFKKLYIKSLLQPINSLKTNKIKIWSSLIMIGASAYFGYQYYIEQNKQKTYQTQHKPTTLVAVATTSEILINSCLVPNNKFFGDLGNWILTDIQCNSLGNKLNFTTDKDTTLSNFIQLTGDKMNSQLNKNIGVFTQKRKLPANSIKNLNKDRIISHLQDAAIHYNLKLDIVKNKFTITSGVSPVYLQSEGVLTNLSIYEFHGMLNQSTGFFSWTIKGEI